MAGNKFDTQFKRVIPKAYKLTYKGLYDTETTVEGNAKQIVNHIMNQQL
jgi:hypothetical protein